jgi:hypothetical protein
MPASAARAAPGHDISRTYAVSTGSGARVKLGPGNYVTSGGEGHVYRSQGLAVKIWDDPAQALRDRMEEKIAILSGFRSPGIAAPTGIVAGPGGAPVGYAMPWVEGEPLPRAFTGNWRAANGFSDREAAGAASEMRQAVEAAHSWGAVLGDGNELNVILARDGATYVDVDSWALPGFPGKVVLPTVYDWHSPPFTREADWFAWAVVTFQLFVGAHPYRGTHPGFSNRDLEGRMKANASVFDPAVRLSPAARPFSAIPNLLEGWYRDVFQRGQRSPPPATWQGKAAHYVPKWAAPTPVAGGTLTFAVALEAISPGLRRAAGEYFVDEGGHVYALPGGERRGWTADRSGSFAALGGSLLQLSVRAGRLYHEYFGLLGQSGQLDSGMSARRAWSSGNRLFAVLDDGIQEVSVESVNGKPRLMPRQKWALRADSTYFGDDVAVYSALGAAHLVCAFGAGSVVVSRARELDGLVPVAAAREGGLALIALMDRATGQYSLATARIPEDGGRPQVEVRPAASGEIAAALTRSGLVAAMGHDGSLRLVEPASGASRASGPGECPPGRLVCGPGGVYCVGGPEGKTVWKLTMG